ncbi:hypothetical protein INT80_13030 [Gallibacterium anatis]|uniref:2-oxoglutarate dehydrogenase E1 component N-terminal domain-containing protein n=1 Tax=Gallibacterium anatis TaxID=750 RepID=A0A930UVL6_9PAST|nr:hypothetical protein [Gallibacterium anatis]
MKEWLASTAFGGANQSYIEDLYESYLTDPNSVTDEWQTDFPTMETDNDQPHAPVKIIFVNWLAKVAVISKPLSIREAARSRCVYYNGLMHIDLEAISR